MSTTDLYDDLVMAGCETDHHESDLYFLATPAALGVAARHGLNVTTRAGEKSVHSFLGTDGRVWLEAPFRYSPFWREPRG